MADRRTTDRLIALGLLWAFGVTLWRGLRRPNDWAEAHWLISYAFGPIKRGLPATLLQPFIRYAPDRAEAMITLVSTALTAVLCLALLLICRSILHRSAFSANAVVAVAVFLTSPFIVMTGHLNGYFDAQIILLSIVAVALTLRGRTWLAALALTVGLLIHETIFIIGFPTVVWAALVRPGAGSARDMARRPAPFLLPLAAFGLLFVWQSYAIDAAELERTLIAHLETFPFIQYDQEVIVPRAFAKSFVAHFHSQSPRVWGRLFDPGLMLAVVPGLLALWLFAHRVLGAGGVRRGLVTAGLVLPFLPLTLHLIAWDTARIWTYPLLVALLVVWVACRVADPALSPAAESRLALAVGLLVLPLNVFGRIPLMDWRVERLSAAWRAVLYLPLVAAVVPALARRRATDYTPEREQNHTDRH